mmetsp:Transcript_16876/g.50590  ORF Transcript_16876/g.50590 Transcript_16876/m.50590 type:complete len:283 (+) Transcript_16876:668-1516(+)
MRARRRRGPHAAVFAGTAAVARFVVVAWDDDCGLLAGHLAWRVRAASAGALRAVDARPCAAGARCRRARGGRARQAGACALGERRGHKAARQDGVEHRLRGAEVTLDVVAHDLHLARHVDRLVDELGHRVIDCLRGAALQLGALRRLARARRGVRSLLLLLQQPCHLRRRRRVACRICGLWCRCRHRNRRVKRSEGVCHLTVIVRIQLCLVDWPAGDRRQQRTRHRVVVVGGRQRWRRTRAKGRRRGCAHRRNCGRARAGLVPRAERPARRRARPRAARARP